MAHEVETLLDNVRDFALMPISLVAALIDLIIRGEREGAVAGSARDAEHTVISLAPGTKVFLACRPVDLRNGFDGLAAKAQQVIGADPFSGHLFIFRGKRGDYFKGLYWDGSGMWLIAKRLERGRLSGRRSSMAR